MKILIDKGTFDACILLIYEAGKRVGQVELEEHMEREQYGEAVIESLMASKTSMPIKNQSIGREVSYRLRSDLWREGVKKSSWEYFEQARNMILSNPQS